MDEMELLYFFLLVIPLHLCLYCFSQ